MWPVRNIRAKSHAHMEDALSRGGLMAGLGRGSRVGGGMWLRLAGRSGRPRGSRRGSGGGGQIGVQLGGGDVGVPEHCL